MRSAHPEGHLDSAEQQEVEADAFWAFAALMDRMEPNFSSDGTGMQVRLAGWLAGLFFSWHARMAAVGEACLRARGPVPRCAGSTGRSPHAQSCAVFHLGSRTSPGRFLPTA